VAKGYYCCEHDTYYGNLVPCRLCEERKAREEAKRKLKIVSLEEWLGNYPSASDWATDAL
jgi:hypothetical protein